MFLSIIKCVDVGNKNLNFVRKFFFEKFEFVLEWIDLRLIDSLRSFDCILIWRRVRWNSLITHRKKTTSLLCTCRALIVYKVSFEFK